MLRGSSGFHWRRPSALLPASFWKNCATVKPKPISEIEVRTEARSVRCSAIVVRSQAK